MTLSNRYRNVPKNTCSIASGIITINMIDKIMEKETKVAINMLVDFILAISVYET